MEYIIPKLSSIEPAHKIMILITLATSEGSGEPRIQAVSPEPSLFAQMEYESRQRVRSKIRHLAPMDGCACAFEVEE